ncbi:methylglyoxal synthase [Sulfitobacter pontiacus]|uniref:methylglyoxal synthase n=1 Tax=Sulfitobacter pontiacus TaxID=60137 RepID=UPI0030EB2CE0
MGGSSLGENAGSVLGDNQHLDITCLKSGPLGGDAQIGAMIAERHLDALFFFIDPLSAMPHDVDVKSLLRIATLYNTILAINEATASRIIAQFHREV